MIRQLLQPHWAALLALLAYGGWSALCNAAFGTTSMLLAFAIQGGYAFASTLLLGRIAKRLMQTLGTSPHAHTMTFLICLILMCAIPLSLHRLAGTPEIFISLLPGLIIGSLYLASLLRLGLIDTQGSKP